MIFALTSSPMERSLSYIVDTLCRNLADVDKTVNAGDDLCECAEGCDAYDGNINNIAFVIFSNKLVPGVVLFLLATE